jgi:hypothetical protein
MQEQAIKEKEKKDMVVLPRQELLKVSVQIQNVAAAVKCYLLFKWQKKSDMILRNYP